MVSPDNLAVLIARGRLKHAKKWFVHRGWQVLPQDERGKRVLQWGADHAWLASPANPERGVRSWCRKWARLTDAELAEIVAYTRTSNKRWSHDQSATVLEYTVRDRSTISLRFLGASDDPNYELRLGIKRDKAAARARKFRAARNPTGRRGRPKSEVPAWMATGYNSKRTYQRHKALGTLAQNGTKNPSRHISKNRKRYGISVPHLSHGPVPRPCAMIGPTVTDLDGIDFKRFGITAIRVMHGTDVVRAWVLR